MQIDNFVIPVKTGIQKILDNTGFRVKPGMTLYRVLQSSQNSNHSSQLNYGGNGCFSQGLEKVFQV
jgi:hypothetical protein